jgi:hypothetical protein
MWSSKQKEKGLPVKTIAYAMMFLFSFLAIPALSQEMIDGTKPLICATIHAVSCVPGEDCEKGLPESVGAPQFLRIDFAKKEVVGPKRTSQIRLMEKSEELITLQGYELGMGWTLALERATGKATITFAGKNEGFIIFGACTTP